MGKKIKVTSQQVLDIIEKYREKLGIDNSYICISDYLKEFTIVFKNKKDKEMYLKVDFSKNTFGFERFGASWEYFYFEDINTFRVLVDFVEELTKIDFVKLPEFMEYVETERKKKKLEEEIENIKKAQEELEKQLEQKRNELWRNR